MYIDLNSDLGEGYGIYKICNDEEIFKSITSANLACGFHSSDPMIMNDMVKLAKHYNVAIGAHPSYPDLNGFGRREINLSINEIKCCIIYQLGALMAFTKSYGLDIQHLKPHGALYNRASKDSNIAKAICEALAKVDNNIIIMGLSNSELTYYANHMGLKCANEVFADRAYNDDGTLVSRQIEGSILHDKDFVISRIKKIIKEKKVTSINGNEIDIKADSICVHGDTKQALEFVNNIRDSLESSGIVVSSLKHFI